MAVSVTSTYVLYMPVVDWRETCMLELFSGISVNNIWLPLIQPSWLSWTSQCLLKCRENARYRWSLWIILKTYSKTLMSKETGYGGKECDFKVSPMIIDGGCCSISWPSKVAANKRSCYINSVFSHWLRSCSSHPKPTGIIDFSFIVSLFHGWAILTIFICYL